MLELLFLLLPVAAGYGWIMGRNSIRNDDVANQRKFYKQYTQSLNFLLDGQKDEAIEQLINFLEVNSSTIETHLVLANLFRRRGEFDRAIKIHSFLLQQVLPDELINKVKLELGRDYVKAGIYGHAESTFLEILPNKNEEVVQEILNLYQITKEWKKGIDVIQTIKSIHSTDLKKSAAHFYCEYADLLSSQYKTEAQLHTALKIDPQCTRALLALADFSIKNADYKSAKKHLLQILEVDKEFSADIADQLEHCYINLNEEYVFYEFLKSYSQPKLCVAFAIKYAKYIEKFESTENALQYMTQMLQDTPNIRAFIKLLELSKDAARSKTELVETIRVLVSNYLKTKALYNCRNCGFNSNQRYWQCPSCHKWECVKPSKGLDGR
ncbi:lipopolysaccharide assembly protein LapB [Flocculibacter collagenilyticus]|uniref:lipopolysaccharide assembly protein LapB n=1 Tax=Flocculibacter collagenilyticus TaxID=2744479 RepID=UPI0018F6A741|nr:lipopolysaccharide assembly protein LapB [Flocculibacter collagenilyticus]